MNHAHLRHDAAWHAANKAVEVVAPGLPAEEQADAFLELYRICVAMLEAYDMLARREQMQITYSRN